MPARKPLRSALVLLTTIASALVAAPGIAQAAPYDGRDPISSGCARTVITARQASIFAGGTRVGVVQLRYSTSCRTVWGRTIAYYSPKGLTQVKRNSDGAYQSCLGFTWSSSLGGYSCYTPMLNDRGVTSYATGWAWTSGERNVGSARTASY